MEISPYYRIKCLFAGETGIGKSSIVNLSIHDEHDPNNSPTIGLAFAVNKTELEEYPLSNPSKLPKYYHKMKSEFNPCKQDFQLIKTHIWDCAGSIKYRSILSSYLRDIDIAFLVFDLSNRESWNELVTWKSEIEKYSKTKDFPTFVIVASKSDLKKSYQVSMEEINERAKLWNAEIYIVSCVQSNSPSMIKRMMYNSFLKFHEKIIKMQYEGKELPIHLTRNQYEKEDSFVKINYVNAENGEKSKFCCFQ